MEGVRRWLVDISGWNPSEQCFGSLLLLLPPHQRSHVTRFAKLQDRKRVLVSQLLQYSLVKDVFGIPFDKISISRTTKGKPYLKNEENQLFPNFNFSISHHGDYVGVACEPHCLVGFDIVSITKTEKLTTLQFLDNFKPYFTLFEWESIVHVGSSNGMLTEFHRYWCLKEAYVKAIGAGIGFGLDRLEFHQNNWTDIYLCIDGIRSTNWRFSIFNMENKHLVAKRVLKCTVLLHEMGLHKFPIKPPSHPQACVAKGFPKEVTGNSQVTPTTIGFDEQEYQQALELPEPGFISLTVDQLLLPL